MQVVVMMVATHLHVLLVDLYAIARRPHDRPDTFACMGAKQGIATDRRYHRIGKMEELARRVSSWKSERGKPKESVVAVER